MSQVIRQVKTVEEKERLFSETYEMLRQSDGFVLVLAHKNGKTYRIVFPGLSAIRLAYALAEYNEEIGL